MRLLLEVWREVGRHLEIEESLGLLAPMLAKRMPVELVVVRRVDLAARRIESIAAAQGDGSRALSGAERVELDGAAARRVEAWCRAGEVSSGTAADLGAGIGELLPGGVEGDLLVGPLLSEAGPSGALLLAARPGASFSAEHQQLAAELLEPFAVALENDRRVGELTRLREAAEADNRALLTRLERQDITDAVVGETAGLREVMRRVDQVAPTDAPVLILGETGSGKEVIARAIHTRSRRATGAMVRVNCGAIPPELIDSELFGHERGSFTGAVAARKGWFERADGGTLFLDEVGELLPAAQVRLLRVLQEGVLERVGGGRPISVDVRIVAATNQDLQAMVAAGTFRKDLWYRLGVFPLHLPPLRERMTDLPALAAHFAARAGKRLSGTPLVPSPADIDRLLAYPWPGNVRELAAVIERATILGAGRRLEVAAALGPTMPVGPFAAEIHVPAPALPAAPSSNGSSQNAMFQVEDTVPLGQAMVHHIELALRATHGRIEGPFGAAARLGINPHTLRARMRRLGIDWGRFRPRQNASAVK